jgi:putative toxin-antitoxin system antitoxin component (TIGR02293 family)
MSTTLTKPQLRKSPGAAAVRRGGGQAPAKIPGSGVAGLCFRGPLKKIAAHEFNASEVIKAVGEGLPVQVLSDLQTGLDVPTEKLAPMLGISKATFHRHKGAGERLGSAVSERVVRFARLLGKAIKVLGDGDDARRWLGSPQFGLGGAVPLDYAKTETGAREVENLLGRIEYGVYS